MLDFPNNPTVGQSFTAGGDTWIWDGTKWTGSGSGAGTGFLPLAGGTMTGNVTFDGPAGTTRAIFVTSNGSRRWDLVLATSAAETGANSGSNFGMISYDDTAQPLASWNFNRATMRLTMNGNGAQPHSLTTYPPMPGSSTIVLNKSGSTHNSGIVSASNGINRINVAVSDTTPEAGGNSGSNFNLQTVADDGLTPLASLNILRANGRMTLNAVGASPHSLVTYPPQIGGATIVLNKAPGQNAALVAASNGLNRWAFELGDATPETGGSTGSDFNLVGYADDGTSNEASLNVNRANGRVSMNGVGATPRSITKYPPIMGGANFITNAAVGAGCSYIGARNGLNRWQLVMDDGTTESGANAGSNFELNAFDDSGTLFAQPIIVNRASSVVTFMHPPINTSDERSKTNIEAVKDALNIVNRMKGVYFQSKNGTRREVGLVAQDVVGPLPEVVFETTQSAASADDKNPMLGIAYSSIVAVLINAINELSAKVALLEGAVPAE